MNEYTFLVNRKELVTVKAKDYQGAVEMLHAEVESDGGRIYEYTLKSEDIKNGGKKNMIFIELTFSEAENHPVDKLFVKPKEIIAIGEITNRAGMASTSLTLSSGNIKIVTETPEEVMQLIQKSTKETYFVTKDDMRHHG